MATNVSLIGKIKVIGKDGEVWTIVQDENNYRFYVTSTKGYDGYGSSGFKNLNLALGSVNRLILNS